MIVMKHFDLGEIPEIQKVGVYAIHNKINDKYGQGMISRASLMEDENER